MRLNARLSCAIGALALVVGTSGNANAKVAWKIWSDSAQSFQGQAWDSKADCELRIERLNQQVLRESCVMVQIPDRSKSNTSRNKRQQRRN